MHPLDGPDERVARAREHLVDLKERIDVICEATRQEVFIKREPGRVKLPNGREVDAVIGHAEWPIKPVPVIISILIGETIYNLRAALDYLVYALANPGAVVVNEKTQFPIEETEESFKGRRKNWLKGVSDPHVAAIQALQPFEGCNWTRMLGELSNSDKHRHHTVVVNAVRIAPTPGSTEDIMVGKSVDVKRDVSVNVHFPNGALIIETLEQLQSEVAAVLDKFHPEF